MLRAVVLLLLAVPVAAAGSDLLPYKQVAAPPADILSGRVRLPDPEQCATTSRALLVPVEMTWDAGAGWTFDVTVPVAGDGSVSLAVLAPGSSQWALDARSSDGSFVALATAFGAAHVELRSQMLGDDMPGWSAQRWDVEHAGAGGYDLRIAARDADGMHRPASGWLVVRDAASVAMSAGTSTLSTLSENEVGIVAHVYDTERNDPRQVLAHAARAGHVILETPSGTQRLELLDDGLHQDGHAGDGVFGALVPRWTSGDVRARVELDGVTPAGDAFERTGQLQFPVVERRTAFSGVVGATVEDALRLRIDVGALALGPPSQLHLSAEVWGTNAAGELVPVCWLSRMLVPEQRDGGWILPLHLDGRWIDLARASAPFALHAVRVQDPDTEVPYDVVDWLELPATALPPSATSHLRARGTRAITTSMLMAPATSPSLAPTPGTTPSQPSVTTSPLLTAPATPPPLGGQSTSIAPSALARTLLLVHGYCSSGSIWPAADFAQPKQEFLDPNQNRTHDQFAQLLLQATSGRRSFGVVAHSQGGPAALHLLTYYVSGLDASAGGRRIQSLAAPYQGTPLASLGAFSCGVNNDMTPAGSTLWLAGIPTWARNEVFYWTTSDAGSACNFFTGLLLTNPEDGTVEMFRGQLPGGHAMGHVTGWCHTTGMTYPAGYTDHARNADMNAHAAR